jgi:predicted nucleotidyltransferase
MSENTPLHNRTAAPASELSTAASVLIRHGVEFAVIGGQAEVLMGSPRITYDVDLCYRRTRANYPKVAAALTEMRATLRNVPPDVPFKLDARTIEMGCNFTFDSMVGHLDLLGYVEPIGDYDAILKSAETFPTAAGELKSISLDDLIRVKTTIKRFKDSESMFQLLAIKRIRDEGGSAG